MLLSRELRSAPLRRNEVMLYAVINPEDGFMKAPLTPTAVSVQVQSLDKVTDYGTVNAAFSQPVSDALTASEGVSVRAWVAQLPALAYGDAAQVLITRRVTVAATVYPSSEVVSVVGP